VTTHRYGEHRDQFCELSGAGGPTALLIHGGFWRAKYACDLMRPMSADLNARGWTTWNVEYRRVGSGGGYPATFQDVAAACRAAGELGLEPLVAIGHSAGGHLALWLASEHLVSAAISLAGVSCLADAVVDHLGDGAAVELMRSTPDESPGAYAHADPLQRLPTGVPTILVHGEHDETVPISQSRTYADAARAAGDDCELLEFPGGHFDVIEPSSRVWPTIAARLESLRPKLPT
jgi:acetyl esterase/lipase